MATEGSLTSRYCVALEELRAEAVRLTSIEVESDPFASNIGDLPDLADIAAMGPLDEFVSPGGIEDLTGWGQFDSMVCFPF